MMNYLFIIFVITLNRFIGCDAFLEGIYCGRDNCYEVLNVTRDATREQISRAYRSLAKIWHPDRRKDLSEEEATKKFQLIAQAHDVLKDEESRRDYDYLLDNPEEFYAHYYMYYRRMYAPKIDVRIVIVVTITLISISQYYAYNSRYTQAIDYLTTVQKYRLQAKEIAMNEGIWPSHVVNGKTRLKQRGPGNKHKSKEEIKQEEEACIRRIITEKMDIKGSYSKPSYKDILWVQLFLIPVFIAKYIAWYVRWIYKFDYKNEPLGLEEKHYLIRKYMGVSQAQWSQKDQYEIAEYMREELWLKENFVPWKQKKDDEMRIKLTESSSYKRYRRYLRKGGPGQITFFDD